MKKHFAVSLVAALAMGVVVPLLAAGQQEFRPPAGPTPRTPSGKVDFSGVWQKPYVPDMTKSGKDQQGLAELPFTPWGEAEWKKYDAAEGDYTGACLPFGMTRSVNTPEPMQIMQSDKYFAFLFEQNSWFAVVPIDGRPHRAGIPTWFGDSVGHWEGDTLVVETTNFTDKTNFRGSTPDLKVIERFTRTGPHSLLYRFTIDDPKTWTKPWTGEYSWPETNGHIYEYACHEGNYALRDILKGARLREKEEAAKTGVK